MKFVVNPILSKEMKLGSRSIKMPVALTVYATVMTLLSMLILFNLPSGRNTDGIQTVIDYQEFTKCFQMVSFVQLVGICIIIPIITASSIAGEREKQTLDIMLTTPVSPFSIVSGKLMSALISVIMFILSGLPAMSLCFMYGGIEWNNLFLFLLGAIVVAFFVGTIGVWASAMFQKTVTSIIVSFILEFAFFIGTLIIFYVSIYVKTTAFNSLDSQTAKLQLGASPIILFFNPASGILNSVFSAEAGFDIMGTLFGGNNNVRIVSYKIVEAIARHWTIVNYILLILMGIGFLALAALKIDSARRKSKKRR